MLSGLPKLLDKNFVVGFFLPSLLAVFASAWAFPDLTVFDPIRSLAVTEKIIGNLTYIALITWMLSILLMTTNNTQYRLLQGYIPPVSWLLPLRWWHCRRFRRLDGQYEKLMTRWKDLTEIGNAHMFLAQERDRVTQIKGMLVEYYPSMETEVMPTRFGNIIRSFEVYPRQVYGADGIPVWLRLASVIPKDFAGLLDDGRAQVDCFVSLAVLALLIALASLAGALISPDWQHFTLLGQAEQRHIFTAGICVVVCVLAYWSATVRALAWGDLVRSAFDCYLPSLIKQLGFAIPPTDAERREFWSEFNALILYQQEMTPDRWPLIREPGAKEVAAKEAAGKAEISEAKVETAEPVDAESGVG